MNIEWIQALFGGVLIGVAVSLMLLWNGRVTGISGIVYGLMNPTKGEISWRLCFIFGLIAGGLTYQMSISEVHSNVLPTNDTSIVIAGLLVGFGAVLGSGCTSGHGICGISRLSARSLLATTAFISAGIIAVAVMRKFGVLF